MALVNKNMSAWDKMGNDMGKIEMVDCVDWRQTNVNKNDKWEYEYEVWVWVWRKNVIDFNVFMFICLKRDGYLQNIKELFISEGVVIFLHSTGTWNHKFRI